MMGGDLLTTLDAVDRLAAALRLRRHQVCLRAGSLTAAALLAQQWDDGAVTIDQAREHLGESDSPASMAAAGASRVLPGTCRHG